MPSSQQARRTRKKTADQEQIPPCRVLRSSTKSLESDKTNSNSSRFQSGCHLRSVRQPPSMPGIPVTKQQSGQVLQVLVDALNISVNSGNLRNTSSGNGESADEHQSMQSMDLPHPCMGSTHMSQNVLRAMKGTGILQLLAEDKNDNFLMKLQKILVDGVHRNRRNALDLAGKVPFSLKMKQIGQNQNTLWVDSAQAGGLYDTADALIPALLAFLEIKGAKLKSGSKGQFQIKKIRIEGTSWSFLVIVCRTQEPDNWTDPAEYDRCGFWMGVVSRKDYEEALLKAGISTRKTMNVTVTPGNGAANGGKKSRSWLGDYIKWTRFEDLSSNWWTQTFGSSWALLADLSTVLFWKQIIKAGKVMIIFNLGDGKKDCKLEGKISGFLFSWSGFFLEIDQMWYKLIWESRILAFLPLLIKLACVCDLTLLILMQVRVSSMVLWAIYHSQLFWGANQLHPTITYLSAIVFSDVVFSVKRQGGSHTWPGGREPSPHWTHMETLSQACDLECRLHYVQGTKWLWMHDLKNLTRLIWI